MRRRLGILAGLALLAFLPQTAFGGSPEIAFEDRDRDGIKVMDRDGANVELVYGTGNHVDWSPDGESVVFKEGLDVVRIDLATGLRTLIASPDGVLNDPTIPYHRLSWPAWSPGAGEIAATTWIDDPDDPQAGIYVIVAMSEWGDKGVDLVYTSAPPCRQLREPTWSPDGTQIATFEQTALGATCENPEWDLILIDRDSGTKVRTIPLWGLVPRDPEWSRDGTRIAFTSGPYRQVIEIMVLDLGTPPTIPPTITPYIKGLHPSWSPDDTQLVFATFNDKIKRYTFSTGAVETLGAGQRPVWARGLCETDLDCDFDDLCCDGRCARPACVVDADCDDADPCTTDACTDGGTCAAACSNTHPACGPADGCCPPSCTDEDDPDCGCIPTHEKEKGPRCSDGIDNDCDGLIDGNDSDC